MRVRGPVGSPLLCPRTASGCFHQLGLVAGGAGVTPMLQLVDYFLAYGRLDDAAVTGVADPRGGDPWPPSPYTRLSLLCLNSSEEDVSDALVSQLREAEAVAHGRLHVAFAVSRPGPEWAGERGHVSQDMLVRHMPPVPGLAELQERARSAAGDLVAMNSMGESEGRGEEDKEGPEEGGLPRGLPRWGAPPTDGGVARIVASGPPPLLDAFEGIMESAGVPREFVTVL